MFDLRVDGIRHRKTITIEGATKGRRIELARFALEQYISSELQNNFNKSNRQSKYECQ